MRHQLTVVFRIIIFPAFFLLVHQGFLAAQTCNNWLNLPSYQSYVSIGDLDVAGTKITVEATFMRTAPYTGGQIWAGDLVSKHVHPTDANYLLRPNNAEITTSNGYFRTPDICEIELNKIYHAAMVYDGSTLKFYRNGYLMSSVPATGTMYQNNYETRIGLYDALVHNTNLIGYINEVRIWNVVRTQAQIRAYMNTSLPSPATQSGLLAYYTFNSLINKQGNTAWNGTIGGSATINRTIPDCSFVADSCKLKPGVTVTPDFDIPDTVCVNTPVDIVNKSTGASSYFWDFCAGGIGRTPIGVNLGNPGGQFSMPVFMDYVYSGGNYYGFTINFNPGKLVRLNFGNSLLNTPTVTNLGNVGGVMPLLVEGIQMVQNEGKWYAIIVAGYDNQGLSPRLIKIDFGANITNTTPVATNWGNIGNLQQPIDLHVFQEGDNWYGFTVNAENNTITRFNFTNSFENTPTAVNLGNIGNLAYPTGIYAVNDNNFWRVFVVNAGNNSRTGGVWSLTRLDFGSSLLNTPTGVNLGNPGGFLKHPRDLTIMKFCGETIGFAVNGAIGSADIVKMDFVDGLQAAPVMSSLGNIGNLDFPHSIARIFRVGSDLYSFITNVGNNSLTRLHFSGCNNASSPNSSLQNPPSVSYPVPGVYNINLTLDDGLPTQSSLCKQVVVVPEPEKRPVQNITICDKSVKLGSSAVLGSRLWNTGATTDSITVTTNGIYWVETTRFGCSSRDSFVVSIAPHQEVDLGPDTTLCTGSSLILGSGINADSYSWSTGEITNTISVNTPGTFAISVSKNNCELTDTIVVEYRPEAVFTVTGARPVCTLDSIQLQASGGHLYNWDALPGISNNTIPNPTVTPATTTNYTVTITDTICNKSETLSALVTVLPLPEVEIYKSNDIDCRNDQVQLDVAGNSTGFEWAPSPSLSSTFVKNPVAKPGVTTSYTVKGMSAEGCYARDTIEVIVYTKPDIVVSSDTTICKNSSVQLYVSGGVSYRWFPETSLDNAFSTNPVATPDTNTRYYVSIMDEIACDYLDSVDVIIRPVPAFNIGASYKVCKGDSVQLQAFGGDIYSWTPVYGLSDASIANPIAFAEDTTEYTVTITEQACNQSVVLNTHVNVLELPSVIANKTNDIDCSQSSAQLNAGGAVTYFWTPSVALNDSTIANPVASPTVTTDYILGGTDQEGCTGFDTIQVKVEPNNKSGYLMPNAFTPNNDGLNDCFRIKYWGKVEGFEFSIFNRWGERIFFTKDSGQCWDGTYKGLPQESGVYVYLIKGQTFCEPEVFRKGTFVLIR